MSRLLKINGQGLVEVAIALPVLLLLLAGSYACCRSAFLISMAETAARDVAFRAGRGLPGIDKKISDSIDPDSKEVTIRKDESGKSRLLPSPFPSLAGRTRGTVEIHKTWGEVGGLAELPILRPVRTVEASVDCWDRKSASGKKVTGFVGAYVATGVLR